MKRDKLLAIEKRMEKANSAAYSAYAYASSAAWSAARSARSAASSAAWSAARSAADSAWSAARKEEIVKLIKEML